MPNKRKICTENLNFCGDYENKCCPILSKCRHFANKPTKLEVGKQSNQSIYIASLNSYYHPESVLNSAYRKVLDFKENAEKILEKEKSETLSLADFARAILDSRSFEISLQHNCIKLKCYITLEKDKDAKKKLRNGTVAAATTGSQDAFSSSSAYDMSSSSSSSSSSPTASMSSGGAKKVNVEVIMKSNPFRVDENEKTTRMELIKNSENCNGGNMLRFTYYVKPECEKLRETNSELFEKGRLVVFTNDFFTIYQDTASGVMNISLNEIVQTTEEQKRTEALGEKLFLLLKDRPRHRALLTNECKLNHSPSSAAATTLPSSSSSSNINNMSSSLYTNSCSSNYSSIDHQHQQQQQQQQHSSVSMSSQEDETYYTRELIQIYGQPIVPSFHKYFNYQLSNTHYGYRTLRRLLNCDILKKFVRITKEEIKSLDRVVEFVQLTSEKCLSAFQLNLTSFYDPVRFENGIVKNWLDVWYVDRLKEKYAATTTSNSNDLSTSQSPNNSSSIGSSTSSSPTSTSSSSSSSASLPHCYSLPLLSSSSSSSSNYSSPWSMSPAAGDHSLGGGGSANCWSTPPATIMSNCKNATSSYYNATASSAGGGGGQSLFAHHSNCDYSDGDDFVNEPSECDQTNHLWFCLRDYACTRMADFLQSLRDYIHISTNRSELILVQTAHPVFEYKHVLSEARRILTLFLSKSTINKTLDELVAKQFPVVARQHIESLLTKFLIMDGEKKVVGFTALFEILMILKRELSKEKNDEMKYSHFLCTLERANQEKLKMAIVQLKCVPCINKFTTNFNMTSSQSSPSQSSSIGGYSSNQLLKSPNGSSNNSMVSQANMSRLLKQMSLIVSTELQQIAIDLYEKMDESGSSNASSSNSSNNNSSNGSTVAATTATADNKPVKYIKLKEEFRPQPSSSSSSSSHHHHHHNHHHHHHHSHHNHNNVGTNSTTPPPQSVSVSTTQKQQQQQPQQQQQQQQQQQPAPIPLSHSSPQFKSLIAAAAAAATSNSANVSSSSPSSSSSSSTTHHSSQMSSLTASFKKAVDLTPSSSAATTTTAKPVLPHIFNPKKDLEQFMARDKKSQLGADFSAFRSTASSFFYSSSADNY